MGGIAFEPVTPSCGGPHGIGSTGGQKCRTDRTEPSTSTARPEFGLAEAEPADSLEGLIARADADVCSEPDAPVAVTADQTARDNGDGAFRLVSRSCWASASASSLRSEWFSIWRMRSRVTLKTSPISSSVRGRPPPRP
jgi:hypothetical protein